MAFAKCRSVPRVIFPNKSVLLSPQEVTFNLNEALFNKSSWVVIHLFILTSKYLLRAFSVLSPVLDGENSKEAVPFPPGLYNLVVKNKKQHT